MSRALVLGGGGPVGIGWETGLAVGLARHGVDLSVADCVVGTSAGSVVGAQVALGHDLAAHAEATYRRAQGDDPEQRAESSGADSSGDMGDRMAGLMEAMQRAAAWEGPPEEARAELGRFALAQDTMPEEAFIGFFGQLAGEPWPEAFACTAVHATTGELVVWTHDSGVDLQRGVASSCSVPGVYPPITVGGARYIDGGMRSGLNADVATGHDVTLVVSVMPVSLPGVDEPRYLRMQEQLQAEIDTLRDGGSDVEVVGPGAEMLGISGAGMFLMDASRAPSAYEAGLAQADDEAERLAPLWNR